jgi:hypothetical protein
MIKKYKDNLYLIDKNTLRRFMEASVTVNALENASVDDLPCYDIALDDYFEDEKKIDPNYNLDTYVDELINGIDEMTNSDLDMTMKGGEQ